MIYSAPPLIDWSVIMPIVVVSLGGVIALMLEMFRPKANNMLIVWTSVMTLVVAAIAVVVQFPLPASDTFAKMAYRDQFGLLLQGAIVLSTLLVVIFSEAYLRAKRIPFAEFYPLALWSAAGAMIMVSTKNLLMIFVGLEVLSIALYVMAGMSKKEMKSEESAIKYFLLGAFASAFMLFGIAYVFGATGSLHLDAVAAASGTLSSGFQVALIFGITMMLVGLMFKSAFAPFHQWTPDVYQGAPTNVTAFMASVSKIAAIGTLFRVLSSVMPLNNYFIPLLSAVAILTMVVGNFVALGQKDVKRILGYSSIANAGYLLVAVIAHLKSPETVSTTTTVYYLISYALMTVGAFAVLTVLAKRGQESTDLKDLRGLMRRDPVAGSTLLVLIVSMMGIPPFAGFMGKLQIFFDAINAQLLPLAVVLALSSVAGLFYYGGILKAACMDDADEQGGVSQSLPESARFAALMCTLAILALSFAVTPARNFIEGSKADQTLTAQR
ncbi:MAG: NADH-quinone oxidoreductase subunit N [Armatimonadetes bacterium]|nr:NADH-quinone oxidoreductase subunit N [Armatimonadota bacterium]